MMKQKPTDYSQEVHCSECGGEITDEVWLNRYEGFYPLCFDCFASEDPDAAEEYSKAVPKYEIVADWDRMSVSEYLDECNDRAYGAYVDRCIDEERY